MSFATADVVEMAHRFADAPMFEHKLSGLWRARAQVSFHFFQGEHPLVGAPRSAGGVRGPGQGPPHSTLRARASADGLALPPHAGQRG